MSVDRPIGRLIGSDGTRPYECRTCGEQFDLEHYVCPACGGFSVERRPGARVDGR